MGTCQNEKWFCLSSKPESVWSWNGEASKTSRPLDHSLSVLRYQIQSCKRKLTVFLYPSTVSSKTRFDLKTLQLTRPCRTSSRRSRIWPQLHVLVTWLKICSLALFPAICVPVIEIEQFISESSKFFRTFSHRLSFEPLDYALELCGQMGPISKYVMMVNVPLFS